MLRGETLYENLKTLGLGIDTQRRGLGCRGRQCHHKLLLGTGTAAEGKHTKCFLWSSISAVYNCHISATTRKTRQKRGGSEGG